MSEETKEIGEIQKMVKQSKNVGTVRERLSNNRKK